MKKLFGILLQNWYKSLHVLFACLWSGAVAAVVLIFWLTDSNASQEIILHSSLLIDYIDKCIIIPSSLLCYAFGLLLSWKSNWGFFKFKWIVVKLVLGTLLILFGIFFLGPWVMASDALLEQGDYASYQQIQAKLGISMTVQLFFILIVIIISTTKPWGRLKQRAKKD